MSDTQLDTYQKNTPAPATSRAWRRPAYDVSEDAEGFHIRVSVPGVARSGVDISIEDEVLNIVATRSDALPEGWRALNRELPVGDYRLNLRLNVPINDAAVKARVEDGVLNLTLPKADEVKPRKIKVS